MPNINAAGSVENQLNRMSPAAADAKLGTLLVELISELSYFRVRANTYVMSNPGLAIKGAGSAVVKAGSAFAANLNGVIVRKAANTDMAALAGTLATGKSAAWVFYINAAGVLSASTKTDDAASHDAALAAIPATPSGLAQLGILVVDNASGSNFVGGTTALDAANVTATYYNTHGSNFFGVLSTIADLESRY